MKKHIPGFKRCRKKWHGLYSISSVLWREMQHPKSERVLKCQAALKANGCPAKELEKATIECLGPKAECPRCKNEAERKSSGLCNARLGHGPGHQSLTFCEMKGPHKIHKCTYGSFDQVATWTGPENRMKFTGYFDDPPRVEED